MARAIPPGVLSALDRIYRRLLVVYPAEHRREYGSLMAQAFCDLCRDAYRRGGTLGLTRLLVHILMDLAATAAIEHLDALRKGGLMKMQKHLCSPISWTKAGLAVLPGLLIVGRSSGLFRQIFGWRIQRALEQNDLIPVYIVLGIVIAGFILERRLAVWSFPALGLLLFGTLGWLWEWIFTTFVAPFTDPRNRFWQVAPPILKLAVFAAIAALAVYQVYKQHGIHIPRSGWVLIGLMILVTVSHTIIGAITDRSPNKWTALLALLPLQLWWMGLILLPIAIGLPLARRSGLLAGLMVVAAEFILVDGILDPDYAILIWTSDQKAEIVLSYIPALFLLVVSPIWVLRSRSTHERVWGLLLPTFIALVSADVIRSIVLRGTPAEYSIYAWLTGSVATAQLLIALALAAVMYHWSERQGPAADSQESREASSDRLTTAIART